MSTYTVRICDLRNPQANKFARGAECVELHCPLLSPPLIPSQEREGDLRGRVVENKRDRVREALKDCGLHHTAVLSTSSSALSTAGTILV